MSFLEILKDRGLVIATGNKGKFQEFLRMLSSLDIKLYTLRDFSEFPEPVENDPTFEGNAKIKAVDACSHLNMPVLADDSGLSVDALNGEPGVLTARYGGPDLDDSGRRKHLLQKMKDIPEDKRSARFVCALCFSVNGEDFNFFRGESEGSILYEDSGNDGFGYDPIFLSETGKKSFASLDPSVKDSVSHRGRAVEKFINFLNAGN